MKGVSFLPSTGKWKAGFYKNGYNHVGSTFESKELAEIALAESIGNAFDDVDYVKPSMSVKYLNECFEYNPVTGCLTWKKRPQSHFKSYGSFVTWNKRHSGNIAGSVSINKTSSSMITSISGMKVKCHRVAYLIYYGFLPKVIDHKNGNPTDNRIINLLASSHSENSKNQKKRSTNKTGITGVIYCKQTNKWLANITVDGKYINLGRFSDKNKAIKARLEAESKYRFSRSHGKR